MTFTTLGATALTQPQTKVLKLVILVHEGMHMTAFIRETIYTDSLGKRYIHMFLSETLYKYILGIPIQFFVRKIPIVSWDPLGVAWDLWSEWSYQVCGRRQRPRPASHCAAHPESRYGHLRPAPQWLGQPVAGGAD